MEKGKRGLAPGIALMSLLLWVTLAGAGEPPPAGKLGKGEMAIAQDLARRSGKSLDEIVAMRKTGLGWGQIAHKLGLQLGRVIGEGQAPPPAGKATKETTPGKKR